MENRDLRQSAFSLLSFCIIMTKSVQQLPYAACTWCLHNSDPTLWLGFLVACCDMLSMLGQSRLISVLISIITSCCSASFLRMMF